ncbi:MAG: nuclear transport factor 2 family protein [Candidatus Spyradocola sp.]
MHVIHDENEAEALGVLIEMMDAYLVRRDAAAVMRLADPKIQFIGVSAGKTAFGTQAFERIVREDFASGHRYCRLSFDSMNCDSYGRDYVLISGEIRMLSPGDEQGKPLRLSASLRRRDGRYLVCGLHASVPGRL